ncbi:autotransporter outer membrane beta-barrel domain-containing protein [Polynucleobacter paneuropaeus]|nr:autotransporter outer membrane beta-barrel domain-containing protein [Polynucleobacter paneuropaeus]MBT8600388.1 autotransporter outer membrane beta-barrel domain-containing protein [Polynucleobacter paneuropaeus]
MALFLRLIAFLVVLLLTSTSQVMAAACSSSVSPYAVDCDATGVTWTTGPLVINSGVMVSNTGNFSIANSDTFTNNGGISQTTDGYNGFQITGNLSAFTNSGSITTTTGGSYGVALNGGLAVGTFTNHGIITGGYVGILSGATITTFNNTKSITGSYYGLDIQASIANINNSGAITSTNSINQGISIIASTSLNVVVGTITNTGTITGIELVQGTYGGAASLGTLNNLQGSTGSALEYRGALPTNYNIIITSPSNYGKLAVTSGTGSTTFGIYTGSTVRNGIYASVLSGITSSNLTQTTGTYGSATWLLSNSSSDIWDLIISGYYAGPSVANTNQSLVNTASALQGTYTLQNSVIANSFTYDCTVFGANNVCVSAGGRNTAVSAANGLNNTSALLIAAYRPHPNYRIGAYADQNLSVSNPGGTVNLGNNTPLIGLFAAWNQRLDGTGTEVKVSAAYGQKNTTINRSVVGSGATASEAGSGSSTLNSQGAQATVKYGFSVLPEVIVSPYVGVRYTSNTMAGYTESTSSSVTAPLTYNALNTNATTALAGVGASYRVIPAVMTFASAGVETDTNTANGTYSATNTSIGTLTPVNFNPNPVKTRPTAMVGAYYDIVKNQRLGVTGIYRQEAYQAVATTTVMATYTVGL